MIPHERTRLTYAEQQTLLELERNLERSTPEPLPQRNWPCQLFGVVLVAVSALLVGGLASSARSYTSVVVEASVGIVGLLVGAALAIDPIRRWVRTIPPAVAISGWRRRRLTRQLGSSNLRSRIRRRRSGG